MNTFNGNKVHQSLFGFRQCDTCLNDSLLGYVTCIEQSWALWKKLSGMYNQRCTIADELMPAFVVSIIQWTRNDADIPPKSPGKGSCN